MGQARERGTFEERKAAAIAHFKSLMTKKDQEREECLARMTPADRRRRARMSLFIPLFDALMIPPGMRN